MEVLYITILFAAIFSSIKDLQTQKRLAYALMLILMLVCGLRDVSIGYDTAAYIQHYQYEIYVYEPLYSLVQFICYKLGFSDNQFLFVTSLLIITPLAIVFGKESKKPVMSVLIYLTFSVYFFANSMNVIRNAIACSFFFVCVYCWANNKTKGGILFATIACCFHFSSLIALALVIPAFFIKQLSNRTMIIAIIASIIIGQFTSFYSSSLEQILSLLGGTGALDNYTGYITEQRLSTANLNGKIVALAPNIVLLLLCSDNVNNSFYYKLLFIGVVLSNVFIEQQLFYRIALYLTITQTLIVPEALSKFQNNKGIAIKCFSALLVVYFIFYTMKSGDAGVFPYHFYFE